MGNRLHVATEYKVTYSLDRFFNLKSLEFFDLLIALDVKLGGRLYGNDGDDEFEVSKENWEAGIERLKTDLDDPDIQKAIEKLGETREEIIDTFEHLLRTGDTENEDLHFAWY